MVRQTEISAINTINPRIKLQSDRYRFGHEICSLEIVVEFKFITDCMHKIHYLYA